MARAMEREPTAYRSLLMRPEVVLADARPMLARLVRGCTALAVTARVRADACSHRHADAVKGGELSYMALAMERELTAYRSLLMRSWPMLDRCKLAWYAAAPPWPVHRSSMAHTRSYVEVIDYYSTST